MDISSAFSYMFEDEEWIKKLAIGGGLLLLASLTSSFIVGIALYMPLTGYMLQTLKNVRSGQPRPLPEWNDFGTLFTKGAIMTGIIFIYILPILIFTVPWLMSIGVAGYLGESMDNPDASAALVMVVASCGGCVVGLMGLLFGLFLPAAMIRYAQFETFGSAFQFGELFNFIRNNIGEYIIAILLGGVASFIAGFGIILCFIGAFFTNFWATLVTAHLYGQLARKMDPAY